MVLGKYHRKNPSRKISPLKTLTTEKLPTANPTAFESMENVKATKKIKYNFENIHWQLIELLIFFLNNVL